MSSPRLKLLWVLPLLWSALVCPQEPSGRKEGPLRKGPSFTASVYEVLVDVIATSHDMHVNDLRPDEFIIYENGSRQLIDSVELQSEGRARMIRSQADTGMVQPEDAIPRVNLITFLLDFTTTEFENQKYVLEAAARYVKLRLGPNDLVAVFATGSGGSLTPLQGFTSDRDLLLAALARRDVAGSAYAAERALLSSQISSASQAAASDASLAANMAAASGYTPAGAVSGSTTGSARAAAMMAQRIYNSYIAMRSFTNAMLARPLLAAIKSIAIAEREIPGRKTLIVFSEGFAVPRNVEGVLHDAVDTANKSNLAIYTVDTQGLYTKEKGQGGELDSLDAIQGRQRLAIAGGESLFDRARQVGSDQSESTLRFIANSTGGFLIRNTNNFDLSLQRINEDIGSYYVLAYRPANREFDGKFREIKVEVTRPGVSVRARSGYYADPPGDSLLLPDQRALFAAARAGKKPASLPVAVEADAFYQGPDAPVAVVTMEVPTDSLRFDERPSSTMEDSLQILGLITDGTGMPVATFGRPLPLQFSKDQLGAVRGGYVTHSEVVPLGRGQFTLELLVDEPSSGNYGYYTKTLGLDPPVEFSLSPLVLSKQVVHAGTEPGGDPLVTGEARILPSATRRFSNGERLIYYFDIYGAGAAASRGGVDVTLSMSKAGRPLAVKLPSYKIADRLAQGKYRIQVSKYVELAGLPPGDYAFKVTARDSASDSTASTESSFIIVN